MVPVAQYQRKQILLNDSEATFFHMLVRALPAGYYVFPNMRVADIIKTLKGKGYREKRNKVLPKHIDFVVCDSVFKPVLAVELDGSSHNSYKTTERDHFKDEVFQSVGIPLERVKVGEDFNVKIAKIVKRLGP